MLHTALNRNTSHVQADCTLSVLYLRPQFWSDLTESKTEISLINFFEDLELFSCSTFFSLFVPSKISKPEVTVSLDL